MSFSIKENGGRQGGGGNGGTSPVGTGSRPDRNVCSNPGRRCQNGRCENVDTAIGYRCICNSGYKATRQGDRCISEYRFGFLQFKADKTARL